MFGNRLSFFARRAVTEYLKNSDDLELIPGQRIYIETKLVKLIDDSKFRTGQVVEFDTEKIYTFGHEAKALSPTTLQKWEGYAKGVRF